MMKNEDEPVHAKPSHVPSVQNKLLESKTHHAPTREIFDSDDVHFQLNPEEWEKISDEDGIQAYQRREGKNPFGDVVAFRGETIIPAPLVKIATILNDPEIQKEWVDALESSRIIDRKTKFEHVGYNRTNVPWPFQDRDFVFKVAVKVQVDPAVMLIKMKSIEDPREPAHDGVVRGEILLSYFYLKQLPQGQGTRMVIEMAVDPKGAIPLWIVNAAQKRWPHNTLRRLRNLSKRESIPVSEEIKEHFSKTRLNKPRGNNK